MTIIEEKRSIKLPCYTSLFVSLGFYDSEIFSSFIQDQECFYDKNLSTFEFPISKLSYLIKTISLYDDANFIPYKDEEIGNVEYTNNSNITLYKHQLEGIKYGLSHNNWLLLDDQGLGKSLQVIKLAEELYRLGKIHHCFIICGVNSLKYNWEGEIKKFSNLSYTILGQKISKNGKISFDTVDNRSLALKNGIKEFFIITNKETMYHEKFYKYFNTSKESYDMVVVDEAHKLKSPTSKAAKALLKLNSTIRIALTGTLILNKPEDSYVALKWTKNVQCNFSEFKKLYSIFGGFGNKEIIGYKNLELQNILLSKCSLRRLKSEVLDLPDKTYIKEYVELLPQQRKLYDTVSDGILAELKMYEGKTITTAQEIAINTRLRQITACPKMVSNEVECSAKLDRLEELVEQITSQGDKVVIFNTYKESVFEEFDRLNNYGIVICTGDQSDDEISSAKDRFQNDNNTKILSCTWQKMGTGHTLTAANYAIFVDTPWTDAEFQQCSDRIYRIGQNKKVFIITLITKDTYDERVQELLDTKKELEKDILI